MDEVALDYPEETPLHKVAAEWTITYSLAVIPQGNGRSFKIIDFNFKSSLKEIFSKEEVINDLKVRRIKIRKNW